MLRKSTVDLSYVVMVKSSVEILQNFVAFSEYKNFTDLYRWFDIATWLVLNLTKGEGWWMTLEYFLERVRSNFFFPAIFLSLPQWFQSLYEVAFYVSYLHLNNFHDNAFLNLLLIRMMEKQKKVIEAS